MAGSRAYLLQQVDISDIPVLSSAVRVVQSARDLGVILDNFGFLDKFGCHGNSICSLENSDSIFEFADPGNPTIHAKSISISCSELKYQS